MVQAFSRLKRLLGKRRMTVPELHRRLQEEGVRANLRSLYRLSQDDRPLERLDLRVAGAICRVCRASLAELIAFEDVPGALLAFPAAKQGRLDELMDRNNDGRLTAPERRELRALVREAEELSLQNARRLAGQPDPVTSG